MIIYDENCKIKVEKEETGGKCSLLLGKKYNFGKRGRGKYLIFRKFIYPECVGCE